MKPWLVIALLIGRTAASAAEPVDFKNPPAPPKFPQAPQAWLGLQVTKPDPTITAQLPSLPWALALSSSRLTKTVRPRPPGCRSWMCCGNSAIRCWSTKVNWPPCSACRNPAIQSPWRASGRVKPLAVTLKLGIAPHLKRPFPGDLVDAAILAGDCGGPMRVVNVAERLATYSTDEGSAVVRQDGNVYKVKIQGPQNELIYQGDLPADGNLELIPEAWRRRVHALRRGLDHALEGRMMPERQPRPRVISPPAPKP